MAGGPVRRGFGGAAAGAGDFIDELIRRRAADAAAVRNDQLERSRTYDAMIEKGADPAGKADYMAGRPAGPSMEDRTSGIEAGLRTDPNQTTNALNTLMNKARVPTMGFGKMPLRQPFSPNDQAYDQGIPNMQPDTSASVMGPTDPNAPPAPQAPLPSTAFGNVESPKALDIFKQKRASTPLVPMGESITGTGPNEVKNQVMGQRNADTGQITPTQTYPKGGTAVQEAQFPGAVAGSEAQNRADVENLPSNQKGAARGAGMKAYATKSSEQQAEIDLINKNLPDIAKPFVNTTATGRAYGFVPPTFTGSSAEKMMIMKGLNDAGAKPVTAQQQQALQAIDAARSNYDSLMEQFRGHVAQTAAGRPLNSVRNTLGMYLQTDPRLAAAVATDFPLVIANLKAIAGTVGRIMQVEVNRMGTSIPGPNDSWQTAQAKKIAMAQMFANVENSILGAPK